MVQGPQRAVARWQGLDDPEQRARDVFTPIVLATLVVGAAGLLFITPFVAVNKPGAATLSVAVFVAAGCARRSTGCAARWRRPERRKSLKRKHSLRMPEVAWAPASMTRYLSVR